MMGYDSGVSSCSDGNHTAIYTCIKSTCYIPFKLTQCYMTSHFKKSSVAKKCVQENGFRKFKTCYMKKIYNMGHKPQCPQDQTGRARQMEELEGTLSSWRREISHILLL